jgi:hypothetical protein
MRLRVRIDVRLPLKKDAKVKDKEGKWCTVKIKYEKLGIFCFVCGVMGHTENKCEVRFSMEQDDGVREWSAEIRADNRRQGGRLTSRWLREDGGGPTEARGGDGSRQPQNSAGNTNSGPTIADLASNSSSVFHNRTCPNQQAIIINHDQSSPINSLAHMSNHLSNNNNNNNSQIMPTLITPTQANISNNIPVPSFMLHNNLANPVTTPNIHSTLNTNQFTPITLNRPVADNINSHSSPIQTLTFNSQPLILTPQPTKKPTNRIQHASVSKGVSTRPDPQPTPNPVLTRTRPQKKKFPH